LSILVYIINIKYRIHTVLSATSNTLYGVILFKCVVYRLRCVCFYYSGFMIVLLVFSFFILGCIVCVIINHHYYVFSANDKLTAFNAAEFATGLCRPITSNLSTFNKNDRIEWNRKRI